MTTSTISRRQRYQSQLSNAASSLGQSFSNSELANLNDSYASSFPSLTPWVHVVFSTSAAVTTKENQQLLLNSYASCRRLLDHIKPMVGASFDEIIDLMDNEGKLKEMNAHPDDYASQYLNPRNTYYVLKVEITDPTSNEKRYTANFNLEQVDQKLASTFMTALNSLNKSNNKVKRHGGIGKQTTAGPSTSNAGQQKTKRAPSRK